MKKEKLIKKYDRHSDVYERNRNNPTLAKWRNKLIKQATGRVLEVGVGVGTNFPYYNRDDVHVTGLDFSPEMIKKAERAATNYGIPTDFILEDINEVTFEPNSFDCIVSTLTLCSYPDPIKILNKFNQWCRDDGLILLMEHGLSSNKLLSITQRLIDPIFLSVSGCHCNRNFVKILDQSKLQVENTESHFKDIIYLFRARPN